MDLILKNKLKILIIKNTNLIKQYKSNFNNNEKMIIIIKI